MAVRLHDRDTRFLPRPSAERTSKALAGPEKLRGKKTIRAKTRPMFVDERVFLGYVKPWLADGYLPPP